jgi:ubiquinone/menaquinone biosynthesis C-methylase UbiE
MLESMYSDDDVAALYDVLNHSSADHDFYLAMAIEADSVLDVGCGTGTFLRRAREAGHAGRLCGIDPDAAMLGIARQYAGIEWIDGTAASMTFDANFDLAVMMGHAFQCLITNREVRSSLAAICRALTHGGRFAFETRNPAAREWESWNPQNATDVVDPSGRPFRVSHHVESVVDDVVTLTETTSEPDGHVLRVDRASLRFLDVDNLARFLTEAGVEIEAQYGNWSREPFEPASPEIITIARAAARVSRPIR